MFNVSLSFFSLILLLQAPCNIAKAQYFYKDIWNPQQLVEEMSIIKNEKVKTIAVKSFDDNGEASEGFYCEKKLSKNYTLSETITRSDVTNQSLLTSRYNTNGLIMQTTDSTGFSINRTEYTYNDDGKLATVKTFTRGDDDGGGIEETHNYMYGISGVLEKMTVQKNNNGISTVTFKIDEKGNITEEEEVFIKGQAKKYFYYYDDKNRLTDVVHYNERAKRLLPDYMYVYDTSGQIKQMISIEEGGGYYIWNYSYNSRKLRETEKCFSKAKNLLGSVQYTYQ